MKRHLPWHHTPLGSIVLWLGSIELAVPVLLATAIALALGTYLDSTRGFDAARSLVYGSWWFLAIMILVCVSLIFAVASRYPWKKRHVGFMIVHASLISLILGGFISLYGRLEGHLPLEEGAASNVMETSGTQVQLVEHQAGQFTVLASAPITPSTESITLAGTTVLVLDHWEHCKDEQIVNNDAPMLFRAVQISAQSGVDPKWVGEEGRAGAAPVVTGLLVRVLPAGDTWQPLAPDPAAVDGYTFTVGARQFPLAAEGQEAFPGWTISSIKRFTRAFVGEGGLTELDSADANPAIDVLLTDNKGTVERHTAFLKFPGMTMRHQVEGTANSGARLAPASSSSIETLIISGTIDATQIGYISPTGEAKILDTAATFPKSIDLPNRHITIVNQFDRAKGGWRTIKAPPGQVNRPALVLRVANTAQPDAIVAYKAMAPVTINGKERLLRFVPQTFTLPFDVHLIDFKKADYPGTDMAMSYQSDVEVTLGGNVVTPYAISMNHPFTHGPWKIYQSGFVGDTLSIFSIMKDPGLPLTYAASAFLCVGILITFFSRSLSWGHPGIPNRLSTKEHSNASPASPAPVPDRPVDVDAGFPVGTGSV